MKKEVESLGVPECDGGVGGWDVCIGVRKDLHGRQGSPVPGRQGDLRVICQDVE